MVLVAKTREEQKKKRCVIRVPFLKGIGLAEAKGDGDQN